MMLLPLTRSPQALAYFERAGHDKRSESDQHGCIGNVCISLGKYDAAIDSLKRVRWLASAYCLCLGARR